MLFQSLINEGISKMGLSSNILQNSEFMGDLIENIRINLIG